MSIDLRRERSRTTADGSANGRPAPNSLEVDLAYAQKVLDAYALEHCTCSTRFGCAVHGPQPRQHATSCRRCFRPTWNVSALCDKCTDRP